jgi:hypothetical protein
MPIENNWHTCTQCGTRFERSAYKVRGRPFCSTPCYRLAGPQRLSTVDRLWSHVSKTGCCWLWLGATHGDGYGKLVVGKRYRLAHQVAYEVTYGPIPTERIVLHRCDVKRCVRPDHLELGTKTQNSIDYYARRHQPACCASPVIWF